MRKGITSHHSRVGSAFGAAHLGQVYAIPNPWRTREEYDAFHHTDLPSLDDAELRREYRCVQHRADYETDEVAAAWLDQRLAAIRQEWARRTGEVSRIPQTPRYRDAANLHADRSHTLAGLRVAGVVLDPPRRRLSRG